MNVEEAGAVFCNVTIGVFLFLFPLLYMYVCMLLFVNNFKLLFSVLFCLLIPMNIKLIFYLDFHKSY